jgi:hypothetical protein
MPRLSFGRLVGLSGQHDEHYDTFTDGDGVYHNVAVSCSLILTCEEHVLLVQHFYLWSSRGLSGMNVNSLAKSS